MIYETSIIKGIFRPQVNLYQLLNAETTGGIGWRIVVLYLFSLFIFAAGAYFGIGTETYSGAITDFSREEFEVGKLFLLLGKLVSSLLYTTLLLWFPASVYWIVLDVSYKKALIVQMVVFSIHLVEKAITYPVLVIFNLNQASNPFSLGVIAQQLINHEYWVHFFSSITLFQLVTITFLHFYLSRLTEKNRYLTFFTILLFYLLSWLLHAFMAYIEVPVLVRMWLR
ncbi:hypothetical protein CJ195_11060 [Bacillus sp. UMB0899]|uniref:hypothetical protein n=1 Tax=Metabacillus schmidteae TaxID=2730405 RepID=UPI000C80B326|nr:hypothetical protein [Metabacillus schmidteae]PMC37295.1 hypothetical protein CJ195_11060 [Bacillus sp. UMB0899]